MTLTWCAKMAKSVHCCYHHLMCMYVSFKVSANANVLQSEIVGAVKMRCYLTGMPELRLGLNDKILFESTGRKFFYVSGKPI